MRRTATTTHLDPALPGLTVLMDDERLRTWLAERSETLLSRGPLRYKPQTTAVVAVRLESGPAFLYAAADHARPKLEKTIEKAPSATRAVLDEGADLLLAGMAADRDLPAARDLVGSAARVTQTTADDLEVSLLVHNPQRRVVARATGGGIDAIVRGYRPARLDDALRRHRVATSGPVTTAGVIGADTRRAMIALDHLPGETLDRSPAATQSDLWRQVGVTLATLHARPPADPDALARAADRADPADTVDLLSHVLPQTAVRWREVLRRLDDQRQSTEPAFCHGDFSADQVVRSDAGDLAFIDWDRAGWAHPGVDLAGLPAAGLPDVHFAAVLEGYTELRAVPADLRAWVAEARLLRAAGPFRTVSPTWADDIEAELTAIEAMLT